MVRTLKIYSPGHFEVCNKHCIVNYSRPAEDEIPSSESSHDWTFVPFDRHPSISSIPQHPATAIPLPVAMNLASLGPTDE